MTGYAALIAQATGQRDTATVALVEELMREDTGGVLDHLSAPRFAGLARAAFADAQAWQRLGAINGVTLADYCTVLGLTVPSWVRR